MASKNNFIVISLKDNNQVLFYIKEMNGNVSRMAFDCPGMLFSEEYFANLEGILSTLSLPFIVSKSDQVSVILPDCAVFTNTFSIPTLQASDNKTSFETTLSNNYKNRDELEYFTYKLEANKQFNTICLVGTRKIIVESLRKVLLDAKFLLSTITFASSALILGASNETAKFGKDSYMFLDIKRDCAKYVLVHKGRVITYFDLGCGYEILTPEPAHEDVLLFSPIAALAVKNSRELAKKAKQTLSKSENAATFAANEQEDTAEGEAVTNTFSNMKELPKKNPRRLPMFMSRPIPENDEGKIAENFRIFVKWGLDILKFNSRIVDLVSPSCVYVNMPKEFDFIFDFINEEEKENKIKFTSADLSKLDKEELEDLESLGGLLAKVSKQSINF